MERRVLPGLVLVSGFCGISYEILYGRLLGNLVGDQFAVNAAVLLTFLSGIGLGTLIAHRLWRHLWAIEAAVGGCALLFLVGTDTIEAWLYAQLPLLPGSVATAVLVCGLLLLVPALLIGCTLPLLAGYLRASVPGALFGRTYAVYNLGAAVTAIGIEFWLLRAVGLRGATALVAGLNGVVALLLATLFWSLRKEAPPASGVEPVGSRRAIALALVSVASAVFQLWMVKFAELLFGPFRETFALVLSLVFLGIAIGSYLVARFRLQFGGLLVANGLGLVWLLASTGWVASTYAVWCESAAESAPLTTLLKLGCLAALMGVPAATFGATVPALLGSERHPALESGRLLAISAFANAFGFLLMVLVLHRYLDYGVIILVAMTLVIAGLVVFRPKIVRSTLAGAGLLLGAIWIQQNVWEEELLFVGHPSFHSTEDLAKARRRLVRSQRFKGSLDVFSINRVGSKTYFFINGYNSMVLESPSEKLVGAFSAMLAPRTDRALVLGVGSGATAGTVALLFDHTDGVEISRVILENLHRMDAHNFGLARSDRATLIHDDAIHFVKGTEQTYSLIINTVTSPLY
ncbi:MAG: spermine synthase, partial [Myxococcota bacterium]